MNETAYLTVRAAARLMGRDVSTVYRWLRRGWVVGCRDERGRSWVLRESLAVPVGLSLYTVAARLGCSRSTVRRCITRGALHAAYDPRVGWRFCEESLRNLVKVWPSRMRTRR